jgi:hypothetical protein
MKQENPYRGLYSKTFQGIPFRTELCARRAYMIFPDILTLPGTVGRGFYVFPNGKHNGTWVFVCYTNTRKRETGFLKEKPKNKKPENGFLYGMEAAAQTNKGSAEKAKGVSI